MTLARALTSSLIATSMLATGGAAAEATPGTQPQTCLTGRLVHQHHDAEAGESKPLRTLPVRRAVWVLKARRTPDGPLRVRASGVTDPKNGTFAACVRVRKLHGVRLVFRSSSPLWRVVQAADESREYVFVGTRARTLRGNRKIGAVVVPARLERAWSVVDTLNILYRVRGSSTPCFTSLQKAGHCARVTFVWGPRSGTSSYFDNPGTNKIYLGALAPASRHVVLHETGHWLQWQLYRRYLPVPDNCQPHYIETSSSQTCAWTEGFADAVAAYALGDYRYVFPSGGRTDFTNDGPTDGWDEGPTVQGRIGSALLDLWRGPDSSWKGTLTAMIRNRPDVTWAQYFDRTRPAGGLSTTGEAAEIQHRHTLDER